MASFTEKLINWGTNNSKLVFGILRCIKPNIRFQNTVIVTRFEDVEEVLARDEVFHVTYAEKMAMVTDGHNFFLGMQNTAEYQQDVSNMRIVARRNDVSERIAPFVAAETDKIVNEAGGEIDFVQGISSVIPTLMVADYFGTPGPESGEITEWATVLFEYLFFDFDKSTELTQQATSAAAKLRQYLDELIAARKNSPPKDDLLGRCLELQNAEAPGMSDLHIRNNLIGLIIGAIPTLNKAAAQILDELLSRPEVLVGAKQAANSDNDELLIRYAMEAFRFRPLSIGMQRIAAEDYVIARSHLRRQRVHKGDTVLPMTESAMFDYRKISKPKKFSTERPDYSYLLFGYGLHLCFGYYINRAALPLMIKPLLKKARLQRSGKLIMNGQWPESLKVKI